MDAKAHTAFILSDNPLFAHGLERLLLQDCGMEVVGFAAGGEGFLDQIRALKPDVIIVDAGKKTPKPCLLLSRLLERQREVMVIRVSLEDNTAALFSGRRWTANAVEDLIRGIPSLGS